MSDLRKIRRCVMAAVLLMAGAPAPAIAIVPVDDPSQLLVQMAGEDLKLSSASGKALIDGFFKPQSSYDRPCLPSVHTGFDMICEYRPPESVEPELFLGIDGTGERFARITSVLWRYPLRGLLWRCRPTTQAKWQVCFPRGADRRADGKSLRVWEQMLRSGGGLIRPHAWTRSQGF